MIFLVKEEKPLHRTNTTVPVNVSFFFDWVPHLLMILIS